MCIFFADVLQKFPCFLGLVHFVTYDVCRLIMFVKYGVCRILRYVFWCVAYDVCRSAQILLAYQQIGRSGSGLTPTKIMTSPGGIIVNLKKYYWLFL